MNRPNKGDVIDLFT